MPENLPTSHSKQIASFLEKATARAVGVHHRRDRFQGADLGHG